MWISTGGEATGETPVVPVVLLVTGKMPVSVYGRCVCVENFGKIRRPPLRIWLVICYTKTAFGARVPCEVDRVKYERNR